MHRDQILEAITRFVIEATNLEDASFLKDDTNLFEAGLLDSLLAVSIVAFCENDLGCEIEVSEMSEENFSTISALADLICRTLEAKQGNQT
ncbi:MAG: acyl carrier protein [Syntrophales bacterium]